MARVVLYMSMSLDGFVTGPHDDATRPLGIGGERLHEWSGAEGVPASPLSLKVVEEIGAAGAVIAGRRTVERFGGRVCPLHGGVAVFVPTRGALPGDPPANVHFVPDGIASCVTRAKTAAGDRDVVLHGARIAQECLRAGLLDEMEIHLVPVVLGSGRRLFDGLEPERMDLTLDRALDAPGVTHLRYRVRYRR
ncbi:dihydrofolate reductase family protein [Actinomycetes bacterium KLBMP 9759]